MSQAARQHPCFALAAAGVASLMLGGGSAPARAGVNFWTPIGPAGGNINALAASPVQPGLLFAGFSGGGGGGLFRSEDGGATWARTGWNSSLQDVVVDPRDKAKVYVVSYGLHKSRDGGATWEYSEVVARGNPYIGFPQSLAIDPRSPSTLYVGTVNTGVFKSLDGGASWTWLEATGFGGYASLAVDPRRPGTVYALERCPGHILRSSDGGATWAAKDRGVLLDRTDCVAPLQVAVDPSTVPGTVYVAFSVDKVAFTYRSTDAGETWQQAGPGGYPLAVGQGVVYAGDVTSSDGGVTWMDAAVPPAPALVLAAAPGSATTVYAGTSQGVWESDDAMATWQAASGNLTATVPRALAIDPLTPQILYAVVDGAVQGPGLLKSRSAGRRWRRVGPDWLADYLGTVVVDPVTPTTLYAASTNYVVDVGKGGLAKSLDGGITWELLQPSNRGDCFSVASLVIDPTHPGTLYAGGRMGSSCYANTGCPAFKSTDGGLHWTCLGLRSDSYSNMKVFLAPGSPSTLYAMTDRSGYPGGLFKSDDAGLSWKEVDFGLKYAGGFLGLAIDPTDADRVFVCGSEGVFRTTDGGNTWVEYDNKLPIKNPFFNTATDVAIDPDSPDTIYAGGTFGVYRSINGGASWYPAVGGLPNFGGPLVLDPQRGNKLYAGSSSGFYTYTFE
ncbi:MAG TPA: hypothetical protein VHQ90_18770 [Thermoanaerobaculia bacterium]|nr:hypothetical protein [Thermoanaerobaculia bacterium]